MKHKIICGHVIPVLETLPDEHVDMLMTSVPYWGLRDYGADTATIWGGDKECKHDFFISEKEHDTLCYCGATSDVGNEKNEEIHKGKENSSGMFCSKCGTWHGQLGLEPTPELYIEHLRMVFAEVKRVLKKTGTCWVNIGDTYGGIGHSDWKINNPDWIPEGGWGSKKDRMVDIPDFKMKKGGTIPKCMCMIPERFAFMMLDLGYILRNKIIWHKPNPMPSSVKDRFNTTYEMLYFFSKNQKYWFDLDAVREPWNDKRPADIKRAEENHKGYQGKYGEGYNAEYRDKIPGQGIKGQPVGNPNMGKNPGDVMFYNSKYTTEHGQTVQGFIREQSLVKERQQSRIDAEKLFPNDKKQQQEYINFIHDHKGHLLGPNPGDFWSINTQPFSEAHFAIFPEKLCEKPILAGCPAEVCKHCGMVRVRITETIEDINNIPKDGWKKTYRGKTELNGSPQERSVSELYKESLSKQRETIGWTDCLCEGEDKYEPGIILDIFGGSGTVSVEAEKLSRNSIYIDIKKDYCEMAIKRLKPLAEQTKLSGEQSKIIRIGF